MTERGNENLEGQGGGLRKATQRRRGQGRKEGSKQQGFAHKLIPWLCTPERSSPAAARVWFVFCEHQSIGPNVPSPSSSLGLRNKVQWIAEQQPWRHWGTWRVRGWRTPSSPTGIAAWQICTSASYGTSSRRSLISLWLSPSSRYAIWLFHACRAAVLIYVEFVIIIIGGSLDLGLTISKPLWKHPGWISLVMMMNNNRTGCAGELLGGRIGV